MPRPFRIPRRDFQPLAENQQVGNHGRIELGGNPRFPKIGENLKFLVLRKYLRWLFHLFPCNLPRYSQILAGVLEF